MHMDENDGRFAPFRRVLDAIKDEKFVVHRTRTKTRRADQITHEDEELLWVNSGFFFKVVLQLYNTPISFIIFPE